MNALLICLFVTIAITYIWDYTPFIADISRAIIYKISNGTIKNGQFKKPFSCSLCMSTWITLIILLVMAPKMIGMALVFGWATTYILLLFQIIDDTLGMILYNIQKLINKLKWK